MTELYSLLYLILMIAVAYLVYSDAKGRGDENKTLWAILVFFLPVIGLIIYAIFRKRKI